MMKKLMLSAAMFGMVAFGALQLAAADHDQPAGLLECSRSEYTCCPATYQGKSLTVCLSYSSGRIRCIYGGGSYLEPYCPY